MNVATIGDLVVNLRANTGQFAGKMKGSRNQLAKFGQAVAPVASSLAAAGPLAAGLAVTAAGFLAVKQAARASVDAIQEAFTRLDNVAKTSSKLGLAPQAERQLAFYLTDDCPLGAVELAVGED